MERCRFNRRGVAARLLVPAVLALTVGACTPLDKFLASIPMFSFMHESPGFDPYESPRPAPDGSVPFEGPLDAALPPVEPTDASIREFADEIGPNPLPMNDETIAAGQEVFTELCVVCHGPQGHGDGPVIGQGKFPFASNLTAPQTVQRSDGYIYGIVRAGRGLMPSYATQTTHMDRWAVVNYVRYLQQAQSGQTGSGAAAPATTQNTGQAEERE